MSPAVTSFPRLDVGKRLCFNFSTNSLLLSENVVLKGFLSALGARDTGRTVGILLAASSFHQALLQAEVELEQKDLQTAIHPESGRKGLERDLISRNKGWVLFVPLPPAVLPSQVEL